jgi:hypothetical protein
MHKKYLDNLLNEILQYDGEDRIKALDQKRKVDKWFRIDKFANGWGVPIESGTIFFLYCKDKISGEVFLQWDLYVYSEEDLDVNFKNDLLHLGNFMEGGLFEVRLFKE